MTPTQQQEDARRYDREGVLKDGERYRAPLLLMDAAHQDFIDITRNALADSYTPSAGVLHKPGTIVADGIEAELAAVEREVRRNLRLDQLSDAWRNPPAQEAAAKPGPVADREAAASARDARLQNAWKGAAA
jgi:hypothetical protein